MMQPQVGLQLRLNRILPDGRAVVVALDHGLFMGASAGRRSLPELAGRVLKAGADAVVLSPGGFLDAVRHLHGKPVVVRADAAPTPGGARGGVPWPILTARGACQLGADAMLVMAPFGWGPSPEEADGLGRLGSLLEEAHSLGIPVIVECLPSAEDVRGVTLPDACHIAAEMGADVIKAAFPESAAQLKEMIVGCPRPIVLAGGRQVADQEALLRRVREAVELGAAGVVFGRNVWLHPDPEGLVRRLRSVVHDSGDRQGSDRADGGESR